ncbi:proton-conducting transporter membrane subunit [Rickettsia endosymbiont of Halotydeus destructor]|uniref:proton-conducting transporter transmembrane domain-containing protein n=1 Tax=Rickettsia endosymbiont of Halotydeus destructor TaxID=2996754 RepID=UPI003BB09469
MTLLTQHFPSLQILLPFFGALLIILTFQRIFIARLIAITCVFANFILSIYGFIIIDGGQVSYTFGGWKPWVGIEYQLTYFNQPIIIYLNFILLFFLFFFNKLTEDTVTKFINDKRKSLFYSVLLFAHTGYLGMVSTNDFFNLYVFIEIASLSSYVLMAQGNNPKALVGAFDYLIMGSIGATFILIGIGFLLSFTGSLNMLDATARIQGYYNSRIVVAGISFFLIGAILKTSFFPLHFWMVRAYTGIAPIILTYLAGISTIIGIYIIFKFSRLVLNYDEIATPLANFIRPIALFTIFIAPYFAYKAKNLRTIIIYSSLTQIGYAFLLLAVKEGETILPTFLIADSFNKIALFLMVACHEAYGKFIQEKISWRILVIISVICSTGLPISPLFMIKINIFDLLIRQNLWLDFIIILISSIGSLFYHYKIVKILFWEQRSNASSIKTSSLRGDSIATTRQSRKN